MQTISIYEVGDTPIGSGGMGRVFQGTDPNGRQVAIKEILPEFASDFEIRTRTEREVELLQQLNNESIVKVYDQFPLNGNFYIVMEFIDGLNIEDYVKKYGAIPYERATRYMVKILDAMQAVHERNFVHRDMKPSNIMIRPDERICILDFGIAKDMGNNNSGTLYGTIIGSDGYMSPEQADGFSIDHRADIYALGCVFYYMLTGHHAYNTLASDFETRDNISKTPFPKLSKYSKVAFPPKMQAILDHATNRNMMRRYQSCREFRMDLEKMLPGESPSHTIISANKSENIFVTVGREGCDILISDDRMKVSRSHLDITYRQFTGGRYYVITDHSANGTLVNGRHLSRGESMQVSVEGADPTVYLACDMNYPLDWEEVKAQISNKVAEMTGGQSDPNDPHGETVIINLNEDEDDSDFEEANDTFIAAIKLYVKRALDFKGRSRRKEYWYMVLANFLIFIPYYWLMIVALLEGKMVDSGIMATYGLYSLASFLPSLSLTIRRLHDIGKDWKVLLLWLLFIIPVVNLIVAVIWIVWMATDSEPNENRWGKCPK